MNQDTTRGTPGSAPGRSAEMGQRVGDRPDAITNIEDKVTSAAREAGDMAADMAETARDKAAELAEQGKDAGVNRMEGFARAARRAADDIEEESPEVARYVRQAAGGLEQAASSVKNRSVGEIIDMVEDFARRQPTAYFGSTVLAGFLLSRFMKSRPRRYVGERRFAGPSATRRDAAAEARGSEPAMTRDQQMSMPFEEMPK
jgi:hypothetical protein